VARTARYTGKGCRRAPESVAEASRPIHGVRESAGEYDPPQGPSEGKKDPGGIDSTLFFGTNEGRLT